MIYRIEHCCRVCGSDKLTEIFNIGQIPLGNHLLRCELADESLLNAPLTLVFCQDCTLVQLRETLKLDTLQNDEPPTVAKHSAAQVGQFREMAAKILRRWPLSSNNLVIEAGSGDGSQLEAFASRGIPVLGLEPAVVAAKAALQKGIDTRPEQFTENVAGKLVMQEKSADIFLVRNVLATVADLNGFVAGIKTILIPHGAAVIEVPYIVDLVEDGEIDTIAHQQLCYFSLKVLDQLFRQHGLFLNDAERINRLNGGLRIFVQPFEDVQAGVQALLAEEAANQVDSLAYYQQFAQRSDASREQLLAILQQARSSNKRIVGYGNALQAKTMLAYYGIGRNELDYIVDNNPTPAGAYLGGTHLPIHPPTKLLEDQPDYVLIFAGNYAHDVIQRQGDYYQRGGKFVVPVPQPQVL